MGTETKGTKMRAEIRGEGIPIIVLHEWLGDHRNWQPMINRFSSNSYQFHCLDLPGYGLSKNISDETSIDRIGKLVLDYADQAGIESFSLIVHSMSGLIGHHLGVTASNRIKSLFFFCPVPPNGFKATKNDIEKMHFVAQDRSAIRQAILDRGGHIENEEWVDKKENIAWTASTPETKQAYLEMFLAPVSPSPQKSSFEKVIIFCGEVDLPFYRRNSLEREFSPFYENFELITLEKCGHYPMLQNPKLVAEILENYLE